MNGRLSFCVLKLDWGEASEAAEPLAFNQGFYNLFLAVGALLGVLLVALDAATAGVDPRSVLVRQHGRGRTGR